MEKELVKKDCRGRTWRSAAVRQTLVDEFRLSDSSAVVFCAKREINLQTFYGWLTKARRAGNASRFQQIRIPLHQNALEARICFPNRVEVRIPVDSHAALAAVLREVAQCSA